MSGKGTLVQCYAGCHQCWGTTAKWKTRNGLALAAQHHKKTGHHTWCESIQRVDFGGSGGGSASKPDPNAPRLL